MMKQLFTWAMAALLPLSAQAQNPEIHVSGNSITILSGDNSPDYMDNTDFGMVKICGNTATRTFTIHNTGTDSLHLANVYTSGPGVVYFALLSVPAWVIEPGGSSSFQLQFDPAIAATETISLNVLSDDADESLYSFTVVGTGFAPEIDVSGDGIYITDGDVTPALVDLTDFGNVNVCGTTAVSHMFTIENNSPGNGLNGIAVTITGANASDFTLTSAPATSISWAQYSTTFTIAFDPSAAGVRNATINISSDDCDENPFEFAITGFGDNPEAELRGNGIEIVNGDNTPTSTDHTNFGSVLVCIGTIYRDFTILNTGNAPLTVGTPVLSGPHIVDYVLTVAPATTVAPGGSTFFRILFNPSVTGLRSAAVSFTTNDCNENPYTVAIHGTGNVDVVPPTAICQNISLHLNSSGTASIMPVMINNGSYDQCGTVILQSATPSAFTCSNVGPNNVTLTVADPTGNTSTCTSVVTVIDTVKPVALCRNINVHLNTSGTALITAPMLNNGSTDACGIASLAVSTSSVTCANIGANNVTLTVTDVNGNSKTCNSIVTVLDTVKPVAVCQNINVHLNTSGTALITAPMLNNGSTDACGIASLAVSTSSVTCANIGANNVTLTVTDVNGNSKTCNSIVTVLDTVKPVAVCQNISVHLNTSGTALITAPMLNNGSTDACGIASLAVSTSSVTCANIGANNVTLTVTDVNGNSKSCNSIVTVLDTVKPVAVCQNISVHLNTSGTALITAPMLNNGSTDACGIASLAVSTSSVTCANIGANNVTLTVTDVNGNSKSCNSIVTVLDTVKPVAVCQNINAHLNTSGTALITAPMLNNGSTDACGIAALAVSTSSVTCANIGANNVTLTVTDVNGNSKSCNSIVTVLDTVKPVAVCQNISVHLNTSGTALITAPMLNNGSTDACGIASLAVSTSSVSCANIGANNITLTVTDVNGNSKSCNSIVTVLDTVRPVVVCQNITVTLSGGVATVAASAVNNGSADACGIAAMTVVPSTFNCSNLGVNTVTLTVTDASGNAASCNATVTVLSDLAASVTAVTNVNCNGGSTGSATVVPSGGAGPFTYNWLPAGGSNATANTLTAGTYTCFITDNGGCTTSQTVSITQPALLAIGVAATPVLCNGDQSTVTVSATGGTPAYSGTGTFTAAAGTHAYTVTDANGCTATGSVTITAPDSLVAALTATTVLCNGDTSTITITASGGTPAYSGTGTFAVTAGNYTYTVTDANGCLVTNSITVTQPAALSASATATPVSCDGGSNGAIDLAPAGGTVPYTFSWNNGAYLTEDLSGLIAGTYSWTVTDTNNCVISGTEIITSPPALTASVTATAPTTCGGTDGAIALAVNGGTGNYSYLWNTSDTTATLSGLAAGTYNCVVTDENGCTLPAGTTLSDPPAPVVSFVLAPDTLCQATTAPFALTGGLPQGGTYSGPGVIANQFDPALVQTGFSVITYTYTDTTGCSATAMDSVWVDLCLGMAETSDPLLIQVAPNPNNGSFVVRVHGSSVVTVQLHNALGQLIASQQLQPDQPQLFEAGETGVYLLTVTDAQGWRTVRRVLVSR